MWIFKLIIVVYFLLNAWIIRWLWTALKGAPAWLRCLIPLIVLLLVLSYPVMRYLGISGPVLSLGAIWSGIFLYAFLLVVVAQLIGIPEYLRAKKAFFYKSKPRYLAVCLVIVISGGIAFFSWKNAADITVNEVHLTLRTDKKGYSNLPGGKIKVAAIADIHMGCLVSADRLQSMLEALAPHDPDILLFLGDTLDDHVCLDKARMKELIAGFKTRYGVWGVLGNHEYISGSVDKSLEILRDSGINILRDQSAVIGNGLLLAGRDDYSAWRRSGNRLPLAEILSNAGEEAQDLPVLLMDHQPHHLEEAEEAGVSLELSGHTHYGQIWPYQFIINSMYENPVGLYRRGNTHYFVSSGAGTWGPPIRNTSFAEVVIFHIQFAETGEEGHQ